MLITAVDSLKKWKTSDVLVIPFWQTSKKAEQVVEVQIPEVLAPAELGDFQGKEGETMFVYGQKNQRLLLLGLGHQQQINNETLRYAFHTATRQCLDKKCLKLAVIVPQFPGQKEQRESFLFAISEAIVLANYHWPKKDKAVMQQLQLIGISKKELDPLHQIPTLVEGVHLARDLVNESAHTITPQYLADLAVQLAKKSDGALKATILDAAAIAKNKMGLLMAVAQGSAIEPKLIVLRYTGKPKSKDHTVIIGKGVTYDTGGLNLKPTGSMETMRCDMAGAATALATVATAATLKLPCNVTAVVPATENAIDAKSYKPGDVITAHDGTTVEIGNTDAEGRLILADAISYTLKHLEPTRMIDLATLTGAIVIALGDGMAGLFANDEQLACQLEQAAASTCEPLWKMPLYSHYEEKLKSKTADISNVGGRAGGAILGALFLKRFVSKNIPWAHIDCAGPAFLDKEFRDMPRHGVGFGVRLLIKFLSCLKS